ncbi:MAG: MBL fold metallo-hydrolase [Syntrophomonadaceae bacterium]|nr:MBL fold metallo-hydrolase [Syntrophomonadaceae bacterium]
MLVQVGNRLHIVFTEEGYTFGNCVLVDDDIRIMIDSGAGKILEQTKPEQIDVLINTHHHYDHIRDNNCFTNARILLHPLEHPGMKSLEMIMALDGWDELMPRFFADLAPDTGWQDLTWTVDGEISDSQLIDCGTTKVMVIHTPGHSKGHCSFHFPEEDLTFVGDICLTKVGPWYGEPNTDLSAFMDSIDRIINLKPSRVVSSHVNEVIEDPIQALREYGHRIILREQRIIKHIKKNPSTIDQLAAKHLIYRVHQSPMILFWEKCMLKNHLERLILLGQAEELEDGVYGCL